MPRSRKYLYVPYADKEEVKKLGAIWDNKEKKFFVPFYMEKTIFDKWLNNEKQAIDTNEALLQFKEALLEQGLIVDLPIMNGKIQRCQTQDDKKGEKSGAYVGFLDGFPAGYIENFKTGYKNNWKFQLSKGNHTINTQKPTLNQKKDLSIQKLEKEQERLNLQRKTALKLEKEYLEAKKLKEPHPYLVKKGFDETFNLKIDKYQNLLIPFQDENGKLWSLQRISKEGKKIIGVIKSNKDRKIEYSARKKGCFYTQIPLDKQDEFLICEGFATAMTIQKALNKPTIMAIDAGNLNSVVENIKKAFPHKQITIFADNDLKSEIQGKNNIGLNAAKEIQTKYPNIRIIIPEISKIEAENGMSDFNDIYTKKGLNEIKRQCQMFGGLSKNTKSKKQNELEI